MAQNERREALRARAKVFAVEICRFAKSIPQDEVSRILVRQLIRSGTSVGANQRSASLAKSDADLLNKLKVVEEEADESEFWIELLEDLDYCQPTESRKLALEASELKNIATAGVKTLRAKVHKA
jgi:four helix bundle protein